MGSINFQSIFCSLFRKTLLIFRQYSLQTAKPAATAPIVT